jgi:uroporphyrinogen-III synthase
MTTPTAIEVNCETGEVTERPLTAEEISQREADAAAFATEQATREAEEAAKAEAKASAETKLAALGLTTADIAALGGN